ncbi:MAG TPA: type II secretion system F family protein [Acidimicrobiia bacterium]|nr:type II secretion system F family protein [Acidimicrobiia bacterium]
MIIVASLSVSTIIAYWTYTIISPLPRLSHRLSPYDTVARVRLGSALSSLGEKSKQEPIKSTFLGEFFRPMRESVIRIISKAAAIDDVEKMTLRLEQAGLNSDIEAYRTALVKKIALSIVAGFILGAGIGNITAVIFFPLILGFVAFSKSRALIDKRIERRCTLIRSEMYTVDQLLALHVRTGAGVSQALACISQRTHGIVSHEIGHVLSRVHAGMPIDESLYTAAKNTPEPHATRTYKLLAAASHRGVDLTEGLLDLAKDLRRTLREDIKATGAKRRAAMLLPTIGILAPIMLLFVAAPIPSIVLAGR